MFIKHLYFMVKENNAHSGLYYLNEYTLVVGMNAFGRKQPSSLAS